MSLLGDRRDRDIYLTMVNDLVIKLDYHLVSYCIQDSYIHLLLKSPAEVKGHTLSAFMHRLNTAFGKQYNQRHGREGTVWNGRFTGKWLAGASAAKELLLVWYIESNTWRRKKDKVLPEQWRWCGAYWVLTGQEYPYRLELEAELEKLLARVEPEERMAYFQPLLQTERPRLVRVVESMDGVFASRTVRDRLYAKLYRNVRPGAIPPTPSWTLVVERHCLLLAA